jgi:hypothetical protein
MNISDAEIYNKNASAWIRANENTGFVIHSGEKPPNNNKSESWDSWFAYFQKIGHERLLKVMRAHENRVWLGKDGVTVPTEWPIDFDPTAAKLVHRYHPPRIEGLTDAQKAEVVRRAMTNAGFVPKEYRHGKPVSPDMLVGEARQRRQAEIAAEETKLAEIKKMPVPGLSEAAKAIFNKDKHGA